VHKLEAALNWHLQQGALQDGSVLQLLVMLAAADGNVAVLSLLLPLFEKMGWLVSKDMQTLLCGTHVAQLVLWHLIIW
jgi:hypothetical protein